MTSKKYSDIKWYTLDNILKHDSQYYIIMGERSNGKTYATCKYLLDEYFKLGKQFAYIKRYDEDIKGKYMNEVFTHLDEYLLNEYGKRIKFYRGQWLVYDDGLDGKLAECEVIGFAFSIANVNRTKGTSYPNVSNIIFEEFMSIDCTYIQDELNLFLNVVSTIARQRNNVRVFMLANTISKYSPYTTALNLKIHRQNKGTIINKTYSDKDGFNTKFTIERTENVNVFNNKDNVEKTVYNIFGNSGVGKMITSGDFETHAYPRRIANVTVDECRQNKKDIIIGKKDLTTFVIRFEDYYYRIYLKDTGKFILAFREIDEENINSKNTTHIINGTTHIDNIINISNLAYYDDERVNRIINIIVSAMRQKDFITISDDDGENVTNGFRLSGITLAK